MVLLTIPTGICAHTVERTVIPTVTVRLYKSAVPLEELRAARRMTGDILAAAGIDVSWLECWSDVSPISSPIPADCARPLRPSELILHVIAAADSNSARYSQSLGFSLIDTQAATSTVATVYADRVAVLADGVGADRVELLARAIAHEIGHLLMGDNHHSAVGLMRAFWTSEELRRNTAANWLFSENEARRMRSALDRRNGTTAAPLFPAIDTPPALQFR